MRIPLNKYCVYHHKIGEFVFYVGMGKASRPFKFNDRNSRWKKFVECQNKSCIEVDIIRWFSTRKTARKFEIRELTRLTPITNIDYKGVAKTKRPHLNEEFYPWKHKANSKFFS